MNNSIIIYEHMTQGNINKSINCCKNYCIIYVALDFSLSFFLASLNLYNMKKKRNRNHRSAASIDHLCSYYRFIDNVRFVGIFVCF